jgi:hypothetical protein
MTRIITTTAVYETIEPHLFLITMKENSHVDLAEVDENYAAVMKLAAGRRYAVLVDASHPCTITKEAMEYTNRPESYKFLIAQAIVVNSLANRLVGNFIIKFHKPASPTKLFSNKESAYIWLKQCMTNKEDKTTGKNNKINGLLTY